MISLTRIIASTPRVLDCTQCCKLCFICTCSTEQISLLRDCMEPLELKYPLIVWGGLDGEQRGHIRRRSGDLYCKKWAIYNQQFYQKYTYLWCHFFALPVKKTNLDFGTDVAGYMIESIVAHSYIMSARDRISKNREHGRTFKERIQNYKWVAGGAIFPNVSSRLVQNILEVKFEIKEDARVKREGTYKNKIQEYRGKKQQINELLTLLASK